MNKFCKHEVRKFLKGRDHSEDLSVDGRTTLEWILGKGMDWIYLAQDRDQWQALANTVMNIWVP
jgi:hypothetical protein